MSDPKATPQEPFADRSNIKPHDPSDKTVGSQVDVGPIKEVDSEVLEGSHQVGDHRKESQIPTPKNDGASK